MKESQPQFCPLQVRSCSLSRERERKYMAQTIKQFSHPNLIIDVDGVLSSLEALSLCVFLFLHSLPGCSSVFPRVGTISNFPSIICPSTIGNF